MLKSRVKYIGIIAISLLVVLSIVYNDNQKTLTPLTMDGLTICTSFYPIYIMALNITADVPDIRLVSVTPPESGCLHDAQISVSDMKLLDKSDIFIINGAGMEGYLEKVLDSFPDLKIIDASRDLELCQAEGDDHDHDRHYNPHTWVSISMAIQQVKSIGEQLAHLDQANKELYLENTSNYVAQLEALKARMHEELSDLKSRNIITFHDAFPYFAQEFDLNVLAVIQSENNSEPSARELAETIDLVKENNVRAIFVEPQFSDLTAQAIARETGAQVYVLDPASSGPLEENAYIETDRKSTRLNSSHH